MTGWQPCLLSAQQFVVIATARGTDAALVAFARPGQWFQPLGCHRQNTVELLVAHSGGMVSQQPERKLIECRMASLRTVTGAGTTIDPESCRRQIASAFRRVGDERNAARLVVADIDTVMDTGDEFMDVSDHANACIVSQAVLQGLMEHYEGTPPWIVRAAG